MTSDAKFSMLRVSRVLSANTVATTTPLRVGDVRIPTRVGASTDVLTSNGIGSVCSFQPIPHPYARNVSFETPLHSTSVQSALTDLRQDFVDFKALRDEPGGIASLGGDGLIIRTQLPLGLRYQGSWNASTNEPEIVSGKGNQGDFYVVSEDGSTNLDDASQWTQSDWVAFNGEKWQKMDHTDLPANLTAVPSTDEIEIRSSTGTSAVLPLTTAVSAGLFSPEDMEKLEGIATNAERNLPMDLSVVPSIDNILISIGSSTGTKATLPLTTADHAGLFSPEYKEKLDDLSVNLPEATTSTPGLMSYADKVKLENIEEGAQVNPTARFILEASIDQSGLMSKDDKAKLEKIEAGAEQNVLTDHVHVGCTVKFKYSGMTYTYVSSNKWTSRAGVELTMEKQGENRKLEWGCSVANKTNAHITNTHSTLGEIQFSTDISSNGVSTVTLATSGFSFPYIYTLTVQMIAFN